MIKLNNSEHSFMFHSHNFLTTDEAGPILNAITQGIPGLKDSITKNHIDVHNNTLKNISLNDDQPLIPHALNKTQPDASIPMSQPGFPSTPYIPNSKE